MARFPTPCRLATLTALCLFALAGCGSDSGPVELAAFPLDDVSELLTDDPRVGIVSESAGDGGSVHIETEDEAQFNLVETLTPGFVGDTVLLRAQTRTMAFKGYVSVELWVYSGEDDARGLRRPFDGLSRTTNWSEREIRFDLPEGFVPDRVRVVLHLGGRGHVWLDDMKLLSARAEDLEGA